MGASFLNIDDIGDVLDESDDLESDDTLIEGVTVIGVHQLEEIYSCFHCKKGNLKVDDRPDFGTCPNCNTVQVLREAKLTAKLFLKTFNVDKHVTVRAYGDILKAITEPDDITASNLLGATRFDARYNEYHVLTSVSRH